jgi:hypothetical protein
MAEVERRRRRLRRPSSSPQQAAPQQAAPHPVPGPPPSAQTLPVHDPGPDQPAGNGNGNGHGNGQGNGNGNGNGNGDERETERGLRGLVGSGSSQVSLRAAMRARDAARPDDADLTAAERDLVIVRRGWVPREDLPRTLR